jgi:hypothetical protein
LKLFTCHACGNVLYFDNVQCVGCGRHLGFVPAIDRVCALEDAGDQQWRPLSPHTDGRRYRMCQNYRIEQVCNWMVDADDSDAFCLACRLNQTIPDLSLPWNRTYWQRIETAKRWLIYGLLNLGLPVVNTSQDPQHGLAFAFLSSADSWQQHDGAVLTGHYNGLITLNVSEADDAVREETRVRMLEGYRTLLGHFRHEVGHYYWERLVANSDQLPAFRALFGDERADYSRELHRHYAFAAPADWQQSFVSAYASMHPWEDWAETWAHYLHIVDTLETARSFSIDVRQPGTSQSPAMIEEIKAEYRPASFASMMAAWIPLMPAMNCLSRSMGQPDLYPFVLSPRVIDKLGFIHQVIGRAASSRMERSG